MRFKTGLVLALIGLGVPVFAASSRIAPFPYVLATDTGRYYFRMTPDEIPNKYVGHGAAYEVTLGGDREMWRVEGWYAFKTFLTHDGRGLVRLGNWPLHELSANDLVVAFYRDGKPLEQYLVEQIIRDTAPIIRGHRATFYLGEQGQPRLVSRDGKPILEFTSVDGVAYTFDVETGKILTQDKVAPKPH